MPKSRKLISDTEMMDSEIRATCKILKSVAKAYPRSSAEHVAIREAADAFIYLRLHQGLKKSYQVFKRSCKKPLTKTQQQVLKRAGVTL